MNKLISDWNIVNKNLHRALVVLCVPMILLTLWQLYTSDKVIEVMRSNELVLAAFLYFFMILVQIGVLAFILRVGRSDAARRVTGLAVLALPFVWVLFSSMYAYQGIGVFGLELAGIPAYTISVSYSLVLVWLVYRTFALPYNINSGVAIKAIELEDKSQLAKDPTVKKSVKRTASKTAKKSVTKKATATATKSVTAKKVVSKPSATKKASTTPATKTKAAKPKAGDSKS